VFLLVMLRTSPHSARSPKQALLFCSMCQIYCPSCVPKLNAPICT
jgi:hypothetical protein